MVVGVVLMRDTLVSDAAARVEVERGGTTTVRATDAGRALESCAPVTRGDARLHAITAIESKAAYRVTLVMRTVSAGSELRS